MEEEKNRFFSIPNQPFFTYKNSYALALMNTGAHNEVPQRMLLALLR